MLIGALNFSLSNVGPEEKYFLARFIQSFGVTDPVSLGVKTLAKRFGLSDRQVSSAVDALTSADVLVSDAAVNGRGKPGRTYRLQAEFVSRLPSNLDTLHEAAIVRLLAHEDRWGVQPKINSNGQESAVDPMAELRSRRMPGRVRVVNRLLMAVLLCRADRFGVVSDVGIAQLSGLTGLNQEQVRRGVERLTDQGLIRAYVPGATGPVFLKKTKSTYFLNLNHPALSAEGNAASVLAYLTLIQTDGNERQDADLIRDNVRYFKARPESAVGEDLLFARVLDFFEGWRPPIYRLLQVRLERYAAYLLSNNWAELADPVKPQQRDFPGLLSFIREDCGFPVKQPNTDEDSVPLSYDESQDALVSLLYDRACGLARRVTALFREAHQIPFESLGFCFVPQPEGFGYCRIALLCLPKSSEGWCGGLVIEQGPYGEPEKLPLNLEADLSEEQRYRYGLLTRPTGQVPAA
jgi:hypothetical protein